MPHMLIIVDEFAELKKKRPEVMEQMISIARIGRSLGVHLILATQNPGNAVEGDIWSNSRFRICLRVAEPIDSKSVIKRPDAADIRLPGRAYVMVGNNEEFALVQSGYSGARYIKSDKLEEESQKYVSLLDISAKPVYSLSKPVTDADKDAPTQLDAVVSHIKDIVKKRNIKQWILWQPLLPEIIYRHDLHGVRPGFDASLKAWIPSDKKLRVAVGKLDNPFTQTQPVLEISLAEAGHMAVYGLSGSGKSTFVQTFVMAAAAQNSPRDIHFYILDFGARTLSTLKNLPHVGDVAFEDEAEKIHKLFDMLNETVGKRKRDFSGGEAKFSNFNEYINSGEALPAVVVVIHDFAAFRNAFDMLMNNIYKLISVGRQYGIYFLLTCNLADSLSSRITSSITTSFAFTLKEKTDYKLIFAGQNVFMPFKLPGRGITQIGKYILEFQTALPSEGGYQPEIEAMRAAWPYEGARPIPVIPEPYFLQNELSAAFYRKAADNKELPIGYDTADVIPFSIPLSQSVVFPVIGREKSGKTNFLTATMRTARYFEWDCYVFTHDFNALGMAAKQCSTSFAEDVKGYADLTGKIVRLHDERVREYRRAMDEGGNTARDCRKNRKPVLIFIDDYERFVDIVDNNALANLLKVLKSADESGISFFTSLCPARVDATKKSIAETGFKDLLVKNTGLMLGGAYDKYFDFFRHINIDRALQIAQYPAGKGLMFIDNAVKVTVTPETPA